MRALSRSRLFSSASRTVSASVSRNSLPARAPASGLGGADARSPSVSRNSSLPAGAPTSGMRGADSRSPSVSSISLPARAPASSLRGTDARSASLSHNSLPARTPAPAACTPWLQPSSVTRRSPWAPACSERRAQIGKTADFDTRGKFGPVHRTMPCEATQGSRRSSTTRSQTTARLGDAMGHGYLFNVGGIANPLRKRRPCQCLIG